MNLSGSYKAEAYDTQSGSFQPNPDLAIQITVDETFDNDHRVVSQTSTSSDSLSKFTFSAADSGLHRLCFTPSGPGAIAIGGWFSGGWTDMGGVKLSLDLAIGATSKIESDDKGKIEGIVGKVKELNGRLMDIRREQVFQRVRSDPPWQLLFLAPSPSNTK
jgi:p24 family protein alpha